MRRSYLYINQGNFQIYGNKDIFYADSLIINVYDASIIFKNFNNYQELFNRFLDENIKIYLHLDNNNLKKCYEALDLTLGKYIGGFYIENPSPKILRRFSLKARDYELKQRLEYKTIDFFVSVDKLDEKIIKYSRVNHILIKNIEDEAKSKIIRLQKEWQVDIVSKESITINPTILNQINDNFIIDKEKINKSLEFARKLKTYSRKRQKQLIKEEGIVSNYRVLNLAKRLKIIDDYPKVFFYKKRKKEKIIKTPRIKNFYTLGEEIGNAVTHGVGAALSIAYLVILIIKGLQGNNALALSSYVIFAISSLALYLMSTIYHSLPLGSKSKMLFQKFDHLTIYLLIAGTYTPFSLLTISGDTGIIVCIFLWIGAFIGTLLTVLAFGKFRPFHIILYIFLGWTALFFISDIIANLELIGLVLLVGGGLFYTIGLIFYAMKLFKYTHMVWHIFVIFGTLLHFLCILFYL